MFKSNSLIALFNNKNLFYFYFIREKDSLHRTVEKLKAELKQLREQCEELCESRADTMRELSELKERFQLELNDEHIADLMDDTSNGEGMDRRLSELRTEVSNFFTDIIYTHRGSLLCTVAGD